MKESSPEVGFINYNYNLEFNEYSFFPLTSSQNNKPELKVFDTKNFIELNNSSYINFTWICNYLTSKSKAPSFII